MKFVRNLEQGENLHPHPAGGVIIAHPERPPVWCRVVDGLLVESVIEPDPVAHTVEYVSNVEIYEGTVDQAAADEDAIRWGLGDPDSDIRGPVLDLLNDARVFAIQRGEDGAFGFYERCDEYFGKSLTREQVAALGRELLALAGENTGVTDQ